MRIACPWCGERALAEFLPAGDAHVARPGPYGEVGADEWADYLFARANTKGVHAEQWVHEFGCRQWFAALRDTVGHVILATYRIGEPRPEVTE